MIPAVIIAAVLIAALLVVGLSYFHMYGWMMGAYPAAHGAPYGMMQYWNSNGSEMQLSSSQLNSLAASESLPRVSNNTLIFNGSDVNVVVLMGPMNTGQSMYSFVIDNVTNPTLVFNKGARVTMFVVNVDTDAYHSMALVNGGPPYQYGMMSMMMYSYAASAMVPPYSGMYAGQSVSFTAGGSMYYVCTVPGHAQDGMYGRIMVE